MVEDLDKLPHPENIIVPYTEIVHDRVTAEIFRGCIRGCRFCQAGFIYRPVRERRAKTIVDIATKSLNSTGYDEVSLCSLSTSDYTELTELTDELMKFTVDRKINFCLPSLRVDNFDLSLAKKSSKVVPKTSRISASVKRLGTVWSDSTKDIKPLESSQRSASSF